MKLVIGLGNPGQKYASTRHNVGFDVLAELAKRFAIGGPNQKFRADYHDVLIDGEKTLLIAPLTFMNCSGESVIQFVKFYKISPEDIVVICDDMNLEAGRLRWKPNGSAGGQNGIKNIIAHLGHQDFPRLRIGIGRPPGRMDPTNWVLGRFTDAERDEKELAVVRAADSVQKWVNEGMEPVMNLYNRAPEP